MKKGKGKKGKPSLEITSGLIRGQTHGFSSWSDTTEAQINDLSERKPLTKEQVQKLINLLKHKWGENKLNTQKKETVSPEPEHDSHVPTRRLEI